MSISRGNSYSPAESIEYTALQFAARKGSIEQIKLLIKNGAELNTGPDTALHLALRKQNIQIGKLLLQAGAEHESRDSNGDYPIHIACTLGLVDIVRILCTLGCNLEVPNKKGLFPLHLASKYGHIHVVRYLCSAGCNIDVRNSDKIRADITALKYGHNNISELLDRLRGTGQRDIFARQLVPTSKPAITPTLRLLGNCGVGKTSIVKSLGAGLFSTLFKRSSSLQSNKSRPSSPIDGQIEMDVTSRQNSLNFETPANYQSTNGIIVQTLDISGVGEVSVWDFSGQENYFPIYHHFLWPNPHCLTAILFNLDDTPSIQIQQISFWLNFLLARQPADCPNGDIGDIILIATHVDKTRAVKGQQGEWIHPDAQKTLETIQKLMPYVPNLKSNVIIIDANVPASYAFKQLKYILSSIKQDNIQKSIGTWTGLLEATISWLKIIQKQYEQFPVLSKSTFSELLRNYVNILASDEHIDELLQQLSYMGEIFCIYDHIIISMSWFGNQLLGELLSSHFHQHVRVTGVYTSEDFQACFNQCDAFGVLNLLEDLCLCIRCDLEEDIEYEFPIYNKIERLEGLWDLNDPRYNDDGSEYGGIRLRTPPNTCHLLQSIFPYIQIDLRRATLANFTNNDSDMDLYQWYMGSKLCNIDLESLITLEDKENAQYIEIKVRGPNNSSKLCFYFLEQIFYTIFTSISKICPGLLLERHTLSPIELKLGIEQPFEYQPQIITNAMLETESTLDVILFNENLCKYESVIKIIMFGDSELENLIHWGCSLKIQDLPSSAKLKLCGLLDPPEPHGRDWCLLALKLGLNQDKIAALDSQHSSHTMRLLTIADCTIGALITGLHDLDRLDALNVVLRSSPIFKIREDID